VDNSVSEYTIRPVPHGEGISFPEPPKEFTIESDDEKEGESISGSPESPASTEPHVSHGRTPAPQPHILTQDELNDLIHNLELSKIKAELLGSRLKQWNLLEKNVRISSFRSRLQQLVPFFRNEDDLVFCYDVDGLINGLGIKYDPQEWRLFIDSSKLELLIENSAYCWFILYGHNPVVYRVKNLLPRNKIPSAVPVYTTPKSA